MFDSEGKNLSKLRPLATNTEKPYLNAFSNKNINLLNNNPLFSNKLTNNTNINQINARDKISNSNKKSNKGISPNHLSQLDIYLNMYRPNKKYSFKQPFSNVNSNLTHKAHNSHNYTVYTVQEIRQKDIN